MHKLSLTIHLQSTKNWYRIQKKKGYLVVFNTTKLFTFPNYKILTDTRCNRDKAAKSVKTFLTSFEQSKDQREKVRACSPDCYRGRFYPERRKTRNLTTYVNSIF